LSARVGVTITFEHAGKAIRLTVSRQEFEAMTAHLLERTRFTITNLLKQANVTWSQITRVLLVGGSTRMPMVAQMLEKECGRPVDRSLHPDEAVAYGAAIYANLLIPTNHSPQETVKVTNVNSHNLCVLGTERQTGRSRSRVLIPRNTPLPTTRKSLFSTLSDSQMNVLVKVIEGGDASGNNSTPIGKCTVQGLPRGLPAGTPVEVTFSYAANGRLRVHARVPNVGGEGELEIDRASGLSEANLAAWQKKIEIKYRPLNLGM
jgi:molecular chaperone DnaK